MKPWEEDPIIGVDPRGLPAEPVHAPAVVDDLTRGASFWALLNAGMYDTPEMRMQQFGQVRYPDMLPSERAGLYQQFPEGIGYREPGGVDYYLEEPSGALNYAKQLGADVLTGLPADIGAALGSLAGGIPGAVLGGAAGEGGRQIWQAMQGEPLDLMSGVQTGLAGAGAGLGDVAVRAGSRVTDALQRQFGRPRYDPARAADLQNLSQEWGVDLTTPELTGRGDLANLQSALRDMPAGQGRLDDFMEQRTGQVENAIDRYMSELAPDIAPSQVDMATAATAARYRNQLVEQRRLATEQLYDQARGETADISQSTLPTMHRLFQDYQGTDIGRELGTFWRALFDEAGEPKTSVAQLHAVKMDIDDAISRAAREGNRSRMRALTMTKNALLDDLSTGSQAYQAANAEFARLSGPIDQFDNSLMGRLVTNEARTGNVDAGLANTSRMLFGRDSSPAAISQARQYITAEAGPDEWQSAVRAHMQRALGEMRDLATTEQQNMGGMLRRKFFGTPRQREQLRAALTPEQYDRLDGLMRLLHATGASFKGQSQTEPRRQISQRIAERSRTAWGKARRPIETVQAWGEADAFDTTVSNLVDAVLAPSGGRGFQIDRALRLLEKYGVDRVRRDPQLKRAVMSALGAGLGVEYGEYLRAEQ